MEARDVVDLVARLARCGLPCWLDGGWGVDALLGRQHRDHDDLDLVVRLADVDRIVEVLAVAGWRIELDRRPTRMVLHADRDRRLDLHPVTFDRRGDGWQQGAAPDGGDARYPAAELTEGSISDTPVPCIGPDLQVAHHGGYVPRDHDRHDMTLLHERFAVRLPPEYG